jgi:hypothetical protein
VARFDGGTITSDAGGLLLREVERRTRIIERLAACFRDHRNPELVEHTVRELVAQRVYALALGYEDLNDHDDLRRDPLLATLVGKRDPLGEHRARERDRGSALAGKSTLCRFELGAPGAGGEDRYKRIIADPDAIERLFVELYVEACDEPPKRVVVDFDATDAEIHGKQEGHFFHGYYGHYCYLPLYIFGGEHLLAARLRPANIDAAQGSIDELKRIVEIVRRAWPKTEIVVRGDSGFCREWILGWCEANGVDYVIGLAKNERLEAAIATELAEAKAVYERTGEAARVFADFAYQTLKTWSRERRVVGKAEHLEKGANPRFVVTSLAAEERDARAVYEDEYCPRGDMENRIKEQQLDLFADRVSAATMWANQLRLWFSAAAYLLLQGLRRLALDGTEMAKAQCGTLRLRLLKIGAQIRVTARKVWVSLAEGYPYATIFETAYRRLMGEMPLRC